MQTLLSKMDNMEQPSISFSSNPHLSYIYMKQLEKTTMVKLKLPTTQMLETYNIQCVQCSKGISRAYVSTRLYRTIPTTGIWGLRHIPV